MLDAMADAIRATGRQVFTARDGSQALAILDNPETPRPCVILLDWVMRPMDGAQFLMHLRARPDAAQLSVVVTSALSMVEAPTPAAPVISGFLPKPFELEDLVRVLDHHC